MMTMNTNSNNHKKTKKKKKSDNKLSSSSSIGFGSSNKVPSQFATTTTTTKSKNDNDYTILPPLEDTILQTLLPVSGDPYAQDPIDLPMDIYERLAYIYGFPNFNYLSVPTSVSSPPPPAASVLQLLQSEKEEKDERIQSLFKSKEIQQQQQEQLEISNLPPFEQFHILHIDPLVLSIPNFFTNEECDHYISMSSQSSSSSSNLDTTPYQTRSKTVGKDSTSQAQRTSTTWFHHYKTVPELMAKASRLFGLDTIDQFEEPQTVRYRRSERFTWHLDALDTMTTTRRRNQNDKGQRIATLLVYLTTLSIEEGGATLFRDLKLRVQPQRGSALLFFPTAGGLGGQQPSTKEEETLPIDIRTLHCGEAVSDDAQQDKWIAQLWLRNIPYVPTAPPGNNAHDATQAIVEYTTKQQ